MALEIMDSMFKPEQYSPVYLGSFFYIFSLTLPHSIAANLAFPVKASLSELKLTGRPCRDRANSRHETRSTVGCQAGRTQIDALLSG